VPVSALERLADADTFGSIGLSRREALGVRALAEEPLPLFAAADQGGTTPEISEPEVELVPMTTGREVVEDYRSRYMPAIDLKSTRDGRRVSVAGARALTLSARFPALSSSFRGYQPHRPPAWLLARTSEALAGGFSKST
jgi:hypothetical protein